MTALTILEAPLPPASDAPIIVDELVLEDGSTFGKFALFHIRISTTNRKRFNPEKLQQLADSIRDKGVAQPILLRPVEPTAEAPQRYEIIAGERRFRASVMAGLAYIPAISRKMSDHDAIELQILENLQREDPHPLEEAEGYERLMLTHGYNADQLAERLKKSRSYIYGRLKLCALALDVREPFLNDEITASTALLIARIPVPKLQAQALKEILKPQYGSEPMSVRAAAQHIQGRYTLTLASAPFDIKDGKLLAAAGTCGACPKRTGNQPVLYPDVDANICTDPECFAEKRAAHDARVIVQANKAKIPVLRGAEARATLADPNIILDNSGMWRLDRVSITDGRTIAQALTEKHLPPPVAVIDLENGSIKKQYDRAALQAAAEKAGICLTREAWDAEQAAKAATPQAQARKNAQAKEDAERAERERCAENLTAERVALYRKVRERTCGTLSLASLREVAKELLIEHTLPHGELADLYPFESRSDEATCVYIDQASQAEVQMLILDLLIAQHLDVSPWDLQHNTDDDDDGFAVVRKIAQHEGIDADLVDAAGVGEQPEETFGIDLAVLQDVDTLRAFVTASPDKLNDVTPLVIKKAPHLVKSLDVIGHETGYMWRDNEWHAPKPEKLAAAAAWPFPKASPGSPADKANTEAARKTLTLKPRATASTADGNEAGPAVRTKASAKTITLAHTLAYTAPETETEPAQE